MPTFNHDYTQAYEHNAGRRCPLGLSRQIYTGTLRLTATENSIQRSGQPFQLGKNGRNSEVTV